MAPPTPPRDADAAVEAVYDEVFAQHWHGLVRLARLLVDDVTTAEDVVQDAFLSLYRHRAALLDPAKVLPYLRVSVVNRARSVIRRRVVARRHLRVAEPGRAPAADEPVLLAEEHRAVLAAVGRLPRRQREVLVLRYWENLPDPEIAAVLGIAEVTVRATVSKATAAVGRDVTAPSVDLVEPASPSLPAPRRTGGGPHV